MKHNLVIVKVLPDGKVDMTFEEIKKALEEAYNAGYNDCMVATVTPQTPLVPSTPWPQPTIVPAPYVGDAPETIKPWFTCLLGTDSSKVEKQGDVYATIDKK